MAILPKVIYTFIVILRWITEPGKKKNLKIHEKHKRPLIAKTILKQKEHSWTLPDLKLHYRAIVTSSAWNWHKNRQTDGMEHNTEPGNKCTQIWTSNCWQKVSKHALEKIAYSKKVLAKLDNHLQKNEIRPVSLTLNKNQFKTYQRP